MSNPTRPSPAGRYTSVPVGTVPPTVSWPALASFAVGLPMLLAFNLPPSSTFLNQAAALLGWGAWLTVLASALSHAAGARSAALGALQGALALLAAAALASPPWTDLPWSLALSAAALIGAAMLAAQVGAALQREGLGLPAFRAFAIGLVVTGLLSSVVGLVQVFAPDWADGNVVARTYLEGRAVGNMRQPNHLSSLLLWALVAAVWLGEAGGRGWRRAAALLGLLFVFVVVLTGSRTGALSMLLLAVWGVVDRRLSRRTRALLLAAPLVYGALWYATGLWADYSHHVFGGETRFSTQGDISSSRWGIWSNTLALVRMHPWLGVGFGEFNFAWTLTPFPTRPVAFFDHTHNIVLQWLVELGIPLAVGVIALLLFALNDARALAFGGARRRLPDDAPRGEALLRPAAFMAVLLILLHSLLEYPLWYAYFLLPAAFAFGLGLGRAPLKGASAPAGAGAGRPLLLASMVLMVGAMAAVLDYSRVVVIFAPSDNSPALAQRIADGRHSIFFSHHADYAAATTAERPGDAIQAFLGAPHYLLDARLLQAWARALDESGEHQRARYVAQRLREFRNDQSADFFAPCSAPAASAQALPFQCEPPTQRLGFEDFR